MCSIVNLCRYRTYAYIQANEFCYYLQQTIKIVITISSPLLSPPPLLKVQVLRVDASQLTGSQPKATKVVRDKEREISDAWSSLKSRVRTLAAFPHNIVVA